VARWKFSHPSACLGQRENTRQDAQKVRPARPQPMEAPEA
jgi:hypothetical protein